MITEVYNLASGNTMAITEMGDVKIEVLFTPKCTNSQNPSLYITYIHVNDVIISSKTTKGA